MIAGLVPYGLFLIEQFIFVLLDFFWLSHYAGEIVYVVFLFDCLPDRRLRIMVYN